MLNALQVRVDFTPSLTLSWPVMTGSDGKARTAETQRAGINSYNNNSLIVNKNGAILLVAP